MNIVGINDIWIKINELIMPITIWFEVIKIQHRADKEINNER